MSTEQQELGMVEFLAQKMAEKLRENNSKPGWISTPNVLLLRLLKQEVAELEDALVNGGSNDIEYEAADVANFAAMIAWAR